MAVTKKQRAVYEFIDKFIKANRFAPSFAEIAEGMKLNSLATVHKHVHNLERKGLLTFNFNCSRSIEIARPMGMFRRDLLNEIYKLREQVATKQDAEMQG